MTSRSGNFNMPPKPGIGDLRGIPSPIKEHLEACERRLRAPAFREDVIDEALKQAVIASMLAMDIERRIRFYKAECYRKLCMWKEALGLYERCKVVTEDEWQWVAEMQSVCIHELGKAARRELEEAAQRELEEAAQRELEKAARKEREKAARRDDTGKLSRDDIKRLRRDNTESSKSYKNSRPSY